MSMPFIAIKCVDEMCTLDSALVQCALLHRAVGGGGDTNHILADQLTLSQSGKSILCPLHYYFTPELSDLPTAPLHKAGLGRAGTGHHSTGAMESRFGSDNSGSFSHCLIRPY